MREWEKVNGITMSFYPVWGEWVKDDDPLTWILELRTTYFIELKLKW